MGLLAWLIHHHVVCSDILNASILFEPTLLMKCSFGQNLLGIVRKWRDEILDNFWPPSSCFLLLPSYYCRHKIIVPLSPKTMPFLRLSNDLISLLTNHCIHLSFFQTPFFNWNSAPNNWNACRRRLKKIKYSQFCSLVQFVKTKLFWTLNDSIFNEKWFQIVLLLQKAQEAKIKKALKQGNHVSKFRFLP